MESQQAGSQLRSWAAAALLFAGVGSGPALAGSEDNPVEVERWGAVEILWDDVGVPHIYGRDIPTVVRGYGYAQMANHAELLLQLVAAARGRSAEYFGPGVRNENLENDRIMRLNGVAQRAGWWYFLGGAEQRRYLDAFVSGINHYANLHRASIAPVFHAVLPVTQHDVLALFQSNIHYAFMVGQSNVFPLIRAWQGGGPPPGGSANQQGSNGWALAPSRSASGNAILLGNPHLPWGISQPLPGRGAVQWFEAQLVTPAVNAHGATFVGLPFLSTGFTDHMGWTHTSNMLKNADLYELTLAGDRYRWEGLWLPLLKRQEQLKVRQPDGTLQTETLDIHSSIHGPLVARKGDQALALRVAGLEEPSVVSQYWDMTRAHNLQQFTRAFSRLQMPYFNVIYADRHGDIMYAFAGQQPARNGGQYADWLGILPGDRAATYWLRTLSWPELPKTINPPGGFVQNGNDPPWTSSFPQAIDPQRYPAYIAPQMMAFRPQHNAKFLLSKPKFSFDEVLAGKMSTRMEMAPRLLPDLIAAARASGHPTAIAAAAVLEAWDHRSDADSRGAALFERWYLHYVMDPTTPKSPSFDTDGGIYPAFRVEWSAAQPLSTPQGLAAPASAVAPLVRAATEIQQAFGSLDVPWGAVHRTVLMTYSPDLSIPLPLTNNPVSGSDTIFGGIRTVWSAPAPPAGLQWFTTGGDGYVQLVEFTPTGPRAQTLLSYGNATRPGSPHITDQLPLFDAKRLRPAARTRAEVEARTVRRESF